MTIVRCTSIAIITNNGGMCAITICITGICGADVMVITILGFVDAATAPASVIGAWVIIIAVDGGVCAGSVITLVHRTGVIIIANHRHMPA